MRITTNIVLAIAFIALIGFLFWQHRQANPSPDVSNDDQGDQLVGASNLPGDPVGPAKAMANVSWLYPPPLSSLPIVSN